MGYSILELVLRRLRQEGFVADAAYPGQMFPQIAQAVAAVHIEKVDRANMTVTMEVSIVCPAAMGGTNCEIEALRATEVLRDAGAVCVQNGCRYDGVAQVYVVDILATFTAVTDADSCTVWPGFYCYVDGRLRRFCVGFTAVQTHGAAAEYVMGEAMPDGIYPGTGLWELELEELIPFGSPEAENPESEFTVKLSTDALTEIYSGCRWGSVRREFTKSGLRRIQKGYALTREVT